MLATLAAVKVKLDIPASDTSRDSAITATVNAANAWALAQTRYDLTGGTYTHYDRSVPPLVPYALPLRPLAAVSAAHVSTDGGITWSALSATVLDAAGGLIALGLDQAASGWDWPPSPAEPPWARWRYPADRVLPYVRITYTTTAYSPPADITDAVTALAAYWYDRHGAGAAQSQSFAGQSTTWSMEAVPPWVRAAVVRHLALPCYRTVVVERAFLPWAGVGERRGRGSSAGPSATPAAAGAHHRQHPLRSGAPPVRSRNGHADRPTRHGAGGVPAVADQRHRGGA